MNKAEFVDWLAEELDSAKAEAERTLNTVLEGIQNVLADGDSLTFVGFGTFKVSERAARTGRNPRTGEEIQIAAAKVPAFKAGKALKDAVNK